MRGRVQVTLLHWRRSCSIGSRGVVEFLDTLGTFCQEKQTFNEITEGGLEGGVEGQNSGDACWLRWISWRDRVFGQARRRFLSIFEHGGHVEHVAWILQTNYLLFFNGGST